MEEEKKEVNANINEEAPQEKEKKEKKKEKKEKSSAELEKAKSELKEKSDAYLRLAAEYDNFRRRSQREKEAIGAESKATVLAEILPMVDNLERALQSPAADVETFKKGVEMTYTQLGEIFKKLGVEEFGAPGDAFDPKLHSAVMHIEDENLRENSVAQVFTKGYKLGDRVIRCAVVQVAN